MEQLIFSAWNQYRSERNTRGVWKGSAKLDGFTKQTIRTACGAHGGPDRIIAAIANYHTWWAGKEYKWTHAWTLCQFLTRTEPHDRKSPQIRRFLPGNFILDENLKDSVKAKRAAGKWVTYPQGTNPFKYELKTKSVPQKVKE